MYKYSCFPHVYNLSMLHSHCVVPLIVLADSLLTKFYYEKFLSRLEMRTLPPFTSCGVSKAT